MTLTYIQGHKVITVAAIKWLYSISLPVCGLFFQRLYLGPFKIGHFRRKTLYNSKTVQDRRLKSWLSPDFTLTWEQPNPHLGKLG